MVTIFNNIIEGKHTLDENNSNTKWGKAKVIEHIWEGILACNIRNVYLKKSVIKILWGLK